MSAPKQEASKAILVVEDDELNCDVIQRMLAKLGYEADTAENGREALNLLSQKRYDVVLMDVQMPEMDGLQATRALRASGWPHADIPVIALTAHAMRGDRERFLESGMDAYLSKPVKMSELREAIESASGKPQV